MPTVPWQTLDHTLKDDEVVVMASRFELHRLSQVPRFFLALGHYSRPNDILSWCRV